MKTKSIFCLVLAWALPLLACGLFQPGFAPTQTAAAQTTVAASWTDTPTSTLTPVPSLTPTITPTVTPDPCAPENLPDTVGTLNDLMQKFEGLSMEAANAPRDKLPGLLPGLQDMLKTAQDQEVPACLDALKDHLVKHIQYVIETVDAFSKGGDSPTVQQGLENARLEHDAYILELERLLSGTPTPQGQIL